MINDITLFFLKFSHDTLIIPILILGFIWLNRETFYHAICLTLLSMLYGYDLKVLFQISSPTYGLIFPSGHMLAPTVLYGWIAYRYKSIFISTLISILLCGIGFSLIYQNYHDLCDVMGGLFFAAIFLIGYNALLTKPKLLINLSLIFASFSILYIYIRINHILPHLWLSFYALIGFILFTKILEDMIYLDNKISKLIASILCLSTVFVINYFFSFIELPIFLFQIKWLIIGASVPISCLCANKL